METESPHQVKGRTPPYSVEAEEYLLSCCLLDGNDTVARCIESKIAAAAFYSPANRVIYEKLAELHAKGTPIDLATLAEELKRSKQLDGIGGYAFLTCISGRIPTTANVGYFIEKIRECYARRELIKVTTRIVEDCHNQQGGLNELIDKSERDFLAVTQERGDDGPKPVRIAVAEADLTIERAMQNGGQISGLSTGFKELDQLTFGFQKQDLIILAARPSMGKTALALNIAETAVMPENRDGVATLIFSLEMSRRQLAMRMIASRARVQVKKLLEGFVSTGSDDMARIKFAEGEISRSLLFIDDASSPTVMAIRAKARRMHRKHKLGLIVVDYLQLIAPIDPKTNREQQVAEISRGLKALAKELDVPVLVLSQLNRSSEKDNRPPRLSDLRESGALEQDADVVLFLTRPKDADTKFQVACDVANLVVAKQRNGPVGDLRLSFTRNITRFENYT